MGSFFFRGWEDGAGEEEAAGIEPWNSPSSLLTPARRDPAWESLLGSRQAGKPQQRSQKPRWLQALPPSREPPRESAWRSLSVCSGSGQGRARPGNLALAVPGAEPEGHREREPRARAEPGPAPLPGRSPAAFSCCFRSECQPLSLDQPKSCSRRGRGRGRPARAAGRASPTDAAAHEPGRARRPSRLGGTRLHATSCSS